MPPAESVTGWLGGLKAGDPAAAQRLYQRYFGQLVRLARSRLLGTPRRAADEEDVALSAFDSFCRAAGQGRFPRLDDRDDLWNLLVVITSRKAADLAQYEGRQKRAGAVEGLDPGRVVGREPTPELAAEVAEECRRLLDRLGRADLRAVALWKMEGYTTEEIAGRLGCVPRSVERKLRAIRAIWTTEDVP